MNKTLLLYAVMTVGAAHAQTTAGLAQAAASRFPQPVQAGTLLGRDVLQPVESQAVLGHVRSVVQQQDGTVAVVMSYGGVLGWFTRPIAVPVDAMALLGPYLEVTAYTPAQLDGFPTHHGAADVELPPDRVIRVGLARPSH